MLVWEKKCTEWCIGHKDRLFFVLITILTALIRFHGRTFISGDMDYYLVKWYQEIKANGGLAALSEQVVDYNLLYQTMVAVLTYIPYKSVYLYKMVSIVFDYVLALTCMWGYCRMMQKPLFDLAGNLLYAAILLLPTVILDSAFWGQSDVIYTSFVCLTLFCMYREYYVRAFVFLGLAFAFKFQAVFILPFLVCYYLYKKKFSILLGGISVLVFWASGIVAYLQGRGLFDAFEIYSDQAEHYINMYMNVTSFWMLFGNEYYVLSKYGIWFALTLCGIGLYLVLTRQKELDEPEQYLQTAAWFVWTCTLFLPAMHERYTYLIDILLVILCFTDRKYSKYAFVSCAFSLLTYTNYLFKNGGVDKWHALIYVAAWLHFSYTILAPKQRTTESLRGE